MATHKEKAAEWFRRVKPIEDQMGVVLSGISGDDESTIIVKIPKVTIYDARDKPNEFLDLEFKVRMWGEALKYQIEFTGTGPHTHPHISNVSGMYCLGAYDYKLKMAVQNEQWEYATGVIVQCAGTYTPGDRYRPLPSEDYVICARCGAVEDREESSYCEVCHCVLCEDCTYSCAVCEKIICVNCENYCPNCGEPYCPDHIVKAEIYLGKEIEICCETCSDGQKDEIRNDLRSEIAKSRELTLLFMLAQEGILPINLMSRHSSLTQLACGFNPQRLSDWSLLQQRYMQL